MSVDATIPVLPTTVNETDAVLSVSQTTLAAGVESKGLTVRTSGCFTSTVLISFSAIDSQFIS